MKKKNLKVFAGVAMGLSALVLASCGVSNSDSSANGGSGSASYSQVTEDTSSSTKTTTEVSTVDDDVNEGEFTITTEDGAYTVSNNVYTIYKGGTYSLSGTLEGQIYVCVTEANDSAVYDVVIELNGATIKNDSDSPIYIAESTDENISYDVEISAQNGTQNVVKDERSLQSSDSDTTGSGAIYSETDLKLKGKGELYVTAGYNNGVHSKDDLTIKNLTLVVNAPNNSIKGNDSVEIESGVITAISTGGDGIKTSNTALSSKGNQKGTVTITGGTVTVYACCDGIDAAYDVIISDEADISIYTDTYSSYSGDVVDSDSLTSYTTTLTGFGGFGGNGGPGGNGGGSTGGGGMGGSGNSNKSDHSAKGIKTDNEISITGGSVYIKAYDDGLHANNDTVIESTNAYGSGTINLSGGEVTIYASDDGIHAENAINITDSAYVNVTYSYEGIEANQITFNGGSTYVYSANDAVNASTCGVSTTPCVYIKSGYVDLDAASGDTDTLDSNGNIYITGGTTVIKNRTQSTTSQMGGTIDCDGSVSMTGGILLSFGAWCTEVNLTASKTSSSSVSSGTYYVKDSSDATVATITLDTSYAGYRLFNKTSDSYTLYKGSSSLTTF